MWYELAVLVPQGVAAAVVVHRLLRWRRAAQPVSAVCTPTGPLGATTIVVPTLNEGARIGPLLAALPAQGAHVVEILVVDASSQDDTRALVRAAAANEPRITLIDEPEKPDGWIGKAWALEHARRIARGAWLLGLDADTVPRPELAATVVQLAQTSGYDAVSFGPRFAAQSAAERWLQPALLTTLIFRGSPSSAERQSQRVLANGQCFLVARDVLARVGGFAPAQRSFSEDVSIARHLARHGARVAFMNGAALYDVRSYGSAREMWREWGRSIDLKDATSRGQQAADIAVLTLVQGIPVIIIALAALGALPDAPALVSLNAALVAMRVALTVALGKNYERRGPTYWLSPLADPAAVARVIISTLKRPTRWRTRKY